MSIAKTSKRGQPEKYGISRLRKGGKVFIPLKTASMVSSLVAYWNNRKTSTKRFCTLGYNQNGTRVSVDGVDGVYIKRIN